MPTVLYRPEVADDLRDAVVWYDEKRAGLGDEFLTQFRRTIDIITHRPLSFAISETGLRAGRFSRFPDVVHFHSDQDEIVIFAVMFGGRDTSVWIDRV